MIGYRDRTYCASDCTNKKCSRFVSDKVHQEATKWWGGDDYPMSLTDYSSDCEEYKQED